MSQWKRRVSMLLIVLSNCIVSACGSSLETKENLFNKNESTSTSGADFLGVNFKAGRPSEKDSLLDSLEGSVSSSEYSLRSDLGLLLKSGSIRLRVVGFTDDRECSGRECFVLSERRAKYLNDWYLSHGISSTKLKEPKGFGNTMPVGDNSTTEGRLQNRRAYVSLVD